MKKDKNAFIKILIVLVITSLALLAIVYTLQVVKDTDNPNVINPIIIPKKENSAKEFDNKGKIVVNSEMETYSTLCGELQYGCDLPIVFDEGNWESENQYDVKYLNQEKKIEVIIPDFMECSNEDYIIPAYDIYDKDNDFVLTATPYAYNPCNEKSSRRLFSEILIYKNEHPELTAEDYLENIDLMWFPETYYENKNFEIIEINGYKIIPFTFQQHSNTNSFFIFNEEYKYYILDAYDKMDNIDTSIFDYVKLLK